MASLKEIKTRINSVNSTMKITSAMKMISSAKLHRAQATITSFLPYQKKLDAILTNVLSADSAYDTPFTQVREEQRVALVIFSSNTSLCGGFNASIIRRFNRTYEKLGHLGHNNILVYPVGKKIADAVKKQKIAVQDDYSQLADIPSYEGIQVLAKDLIHKFVKKEIDKVVLIYHHFISTGTQKLTNATFLPFDLKEGVKEADQTGTKREIDYIFEPNKEEILGGLIPTVLYSRLYAALLDSGASEHAARMMAMQTATDNAMDLKAELNIVYNKTRQQSVTNELLDIIGGSSALQ